MSYLLVMRYSLWYTCFHFYHLRASHILKRSSVRTCMSNTSALSVLSWEKKERLDLVFLTICHYKDDISPPSSDCYLLWDRNRILYQIQDSCFLSGCGGRLMKQHAIKNIPAVNSLLKYIKRLSVTLMVSSFVGRGKKNTKKKCTCEKLLHEQLLSYSAYE